MGKGAGGAAAGGGAGSVGHRWVPGASWDTPLSLLLSQYHGLLHVWQLRALEHVPEFGTANTDMEQCPPGGLSSLRSKVLDKMQFKK